MKIGGILLVEDDRRDEELMTLALRRHGLGKEVVVARDGVEALDYLLGEGEHARRSRELPVLVLLDLHLPLLDGFEVLRRARADARTAILPFVILTTSAEESDRLAGYSAGANSYVQKPVDFVEFTEVVRKLGEYWLHLNQPPPPRKLLTQ